MRLSRSLRSFFMRLFLPGFLTKERDDNGDWLAVCRQDFRLMARFISFLASVSFIFWRLSWSFRPRPTAT